MKIEDLNPWWKTGRIEQEFLSLERREVFDEIIKFMKEKQIIAITGLRRTGKTVIMHHLIDHILKASHKENIIYFSFDLFDKNIEDILNYYKELLNKDFKKERIFLFLDEIQKHDNWENELKILYDNFSNIKFIISGSSSLFIEKKTKESLGGRVYSFTFKPLTFKEYVKLKKTKIDKNKIDLYKDELNEALKHYVKIGGFPELLDKEDEAVIGKYIKELVIDKVIFIDIPQAFEIEEPELLVKILSIISSNPGIIIDYESLASDLKRNRKTISNYLFYLEKAFLIKKVYNFSKNILTSEKKLKKFYPSSTAIARLFNADEGKVIENTVIMNQDFQFFSRFGNYEIDFIYTNKQTYPIEVKYKNEIKKKEAKGVIWFMDTFNCNQGLIITKDLETHEKIKEKIIKYIPLWKWLLEEQP